MGARLVLERTAKGRVTCKQLLALLQVVKPNDKVSPWKEEVLHSRYPHVIDRENVREVIAQHYFHFRQGMSESMMAKLHMALSNSDLFTPHDGTLGVKSKT